MLAPSSEGLILYQAYGNLYAMTGIKRRRRDISSGGVKNLATASGRGRLKEDIESSTWRRRLDYKNDIRDILDLTFSIDVDKEKLILCKRTENDIRNILDLTFSIDVDEEKLLLCKRTEVTNYELILVGRNILVTKANKRFNELISRDLISIFHDMELELLISELPDIDFKNLKWMLENDIRDILDLTFSADVDEEKLLLCKRTEVIDYELILGGRNIEVTKANKRKYVDVIVEHWLTTAIKPQINAFLKGLMN
uniref:HECT-type E3 ubiquitin transferase n=1 Tax=Tanacetum cinerariifolium TaxID=118510 RepID=A0A6L2KKA9_TANCI|nr:E3 ubiquitin-protein ligase UPL2-like [Tanacetum cinerariifolium]